MKHIVYSGMASATEVTGGKYSAPPFDSKFLSLSLSRHEINHSSSHKAFVLGKNAIGNYAGSKSGLAFETTTIVSPGNYMENFLIEDLAAIFRGFPYIPDEEGYLTLATPHWGGTEHVPYIAIEADYGDLVHGVLLDPVKYNGRFIQGFSQSITSDQVTKDFQEGKQAAIPFLMLLFT